MKNLSNENILHVSQKTIEYIQFKKLLEYPEIQHCYTLRKNEINFRSDHNTMLQRSYDAICTALNWNKDNIIRPHQTHTNNIESVYHSGQQFSEVDGIITNQEKIILTTTSADCTSLLLYDPVNKVIGNIHSGWRGTLQRIGQKAILKMRDEYQCKPENMICCIGPHIRSCHFEVERDVMEQFKNEFTDLENMKEIIQIGRRVNGIQKYQIDTAKINIQILKKVGLLDRNIIDSKICTVCETTSFHSYRVDKEESGRNMAMIEINY